MKVRVAVTLSRRSPAYNNPVGCFIGALSTSIFGEKLGRRKTVAAGGITMIIGAVIQASSYSRAQMIVGRIVSGYGMGIINSTVPVIQAEFSPKASRGICALSPVSSRLRLKPCRLALQGFGPWSGLNPCFRLQRLADVKTRRMCPAIDTQLWNIPCLLDRLCLLQSHRKLCLESARYPTMLLHHPYVLHPSHYPGDPSMACCP